jgi:hypothetical protein
MPHVAKTEVNMGRCKCLVVGIGDVDPQVGLVRDEEAGRRTCRASRCHDGHNSSKNHRHVLARFGIKQPDVCACCCQGSLHRRLSDEQAEQFSSHDLVERIEDGAAVTKLPAAATNDHGVQGKASGPTPIR